jgi:hypothetical protein
MDLLTEINFYIDKYQVISCIWFIKFKEDQYEQIENSPAIWE